MEVKFTCSHRVEVKGRGEDPWLEILYTPTATDEWKCQDGQSRKVAIQLFWTPQANSLDCDASAKTSICPSLPPLRSLIVHVLRTMPELVLRFAKFTATVAVTLWRKGRSIVRHRPHKRRGFRRKGAPTFELCDFQHVACLNHFPRISYLTFNLLLELMSDSFGAVCSTLWRLSCRSGRGCWMDSSISITYTQRCNNTQCVCVCVWACVVSAADRSLLCFFWVSEGGAAAHYADETLGLKPRV